MKVEQKSPKLESGVLRRMAFDTWYSDEIGTDTRKKVTDLEVFLVKALYVKAGWTYDEIRETLGLDERVKKSWISMVVGGFSRKNVKYHPRMRHPEIFHTLTDNAFR
ncbi:hypothetical protein [Salmonella phage SSBI34]|nr:hypothetical protein [Salmonella phage SSBI34]